MIENEGDPRQTIISNGMGKTKYTLWRDLETFGHFLLYIRRFMFRIWVAPQLAVFSNQTAVFVDYPCAGGLRMWNSWKLSWHLRNTRLRTMEHAPTFDLPIFPSLVPVKNRRVETCWNLRQPRSRQKYLVFEELMATAEQQQLGEFWMMLWLAKILDITQLVGWPFKSKTLTSDNLTLGTQDQVTSLMI